MTPENQVKRHLATIQERIDYLTGKIVNCSAPAKSFHMRERAALIWALGKVEDEKQTGET